MLVPAVRRLGLLACAVVVACGGSAPPARLAGRPSVVVVTLDTLRRDAVGRGTKTLDAFLESATDFRGARTTAPITVPAHLSLLSGLHPATHGIHDNSSARVPEDRGYPLLAEEFRAAGYATAAFLGCSVLGRHTGLDAGFDVYDCPEGEAGTFRELDAFARVEAPVAWLASRTEPFFLWVHFFDPHRPYRPYEFDVERRIPADVGNAHPEHRDELRAYHGEVLRTDAALSKLLEAIPDDAIVVIASDHGEGLFDHGEPTHLHQCWRTTVDVLLAVRSPGLPRGRADEGPRSLVDVAPTLRAWCGLPAAPHEGGMLSEESGRVIVAESIAAWREFRWGQVFVATDGSFTLLESGPRVQLFDRRADPGELRPLRDLAGHEAYERLDRALQGYRSAKKNRDAGQIDLAHATPYGHMRLPETVYLRRPENAKLVDPGTRFDMQKRYIDAQNLYAVAAKAGDLAQMAGVADQFEGLAADEPANPAFHHKAMTAESFIATRLAADLRRPWSSRAARSALAAIHCGYRVASLLTLLSERCVETGDRPLARQAFDLALSRRIVPDLECARAVALLGHALTQWGDAEADHELEAWLDWCAVKLDPRAIADLRADAMAHPARGSALDR